MRSRGLRWSAPGNAPRRLGAQLHPVIAARLAAGPVGFQDFSSALPALMFNQGACEGCWAHSEANLRYGMANLLGQPLSDVPSPLYFMQANYARLRALSTPAGQPLPVLLDQGAQLADAALSSSIWGSVALQAREQDGNTDVPATTSDVGQPVAMPEPDVVELQRGATALFGGEYSIEISTEAPQLLMAALDARILVWDGFYADAACESLGPSEILGAPNTSTPGGGHSNMYYGYDLNASRKYPVDGPVFFKRNTWGAGYSRGGNYVVSVAHVVNAWSLWPFAIQGTVPS